ncbi:hypothetical protein J5N97_002784 [Dioscorea zingiberensis]|uniref:Uncharacterized protein n=1 Tax=Dioscorea zingiberensis TaxID=325984 RepID=A0A9D5D5F4_9LILI|nr:hypothetical protein J5N97_002784 [Dioscorea zingiberensis]
MYVYQSIQSSKEPLNHFATKHGRDPSSNVADDEEKGAVHVLPTNVSTYSNQRVLHSSDVAGREGVGFLGANGMNKDAEEHLEVISQEYYHELSLDNSCSTEIEPAQNVRNIGQMQEAARPLHRLMGYSSAREFLKTRLFEQPMQDTHQNLQDRRGRGGIATLSRHSADETSPNFMENYDEDESPKKLKTMKVGLPLPSMVKRGVRELNHGLESLKIKVHVNRTASAP